AEADIVILAARVKQNVALLAELDEHVRQPAVVTDTGSTKRDIVSAAAGLPPRFTFIGGHPLGGAAHSGLEHARPDLFVGRPWLLTPTMARGEGRAQGTDIESTDANHTDGRRGRPAGRPQPSGHAAGQPTAL